MDKYVKMNNCPILSCFKGEKSALNPNVLKSNNAGHQQLIRLVQESFFLTGLCITQVPY